MGININVRKPKKFLGTEYPENNDDWSYIYTLDFSPIKHLTKFKTGYWKADFYHKPSFSMSYGSFTRVFRQGISKAMYDMEYDPCVEAIENGTIAADAPFAEMLDFADNEGCFDYAVAEKLLKDFREYADKILPTLDKYTQECYADYMAVLEKCVEVQGVVDYY